MKNTHNALTCLFGHHQYSKKLTKDKYGNWIHLCKICRKKAYWKGHDSVACWDDYDEEGNVIHVKWANGDEYWYDKKGDLIRKKYPDGEEVRDYYDKNGNTIHTKGNK